MTSTIFQRITRLIVESIETGTAEFHMPWHGGGSALSCPRNAITGRAYRGVNILSLWLGARSAGFESGEWATYRQWSELGGPPPGRPLRRRSAPRNPRPPDVGWITLITGTTDQSPQDLELFRYNVRACQAGERST